MRNASIFILLVIATATYATVDFDPFLSGRAYVTSDTATVTTNINLRVDIRLLGKRELIEPDWSEALPDELEVMSATRIVSPTTNSTTQQIVTDVTPTSISYELSLTALAPGTYEIGPFAIAAHVAETGSDELTATIEPITITVESILTGDTALADLKDPLDPPPDYLKIALIATGSALALGLLIGGAVLIVRNRPEPPPTPPTPAHHTALAEIDSLLASDLIETKQWMPYFVELSVILRRYIEGRFDLHAPTQTTEEFLRDPRMKHMFDHAHDTLIRGFLGQADVIKFAEGAMDATQAQHAAGRVRTFVVETAATEASA